MKAEQKKNGKHSTKKHLADLSNRSSNRPRFGQMKTKIDITRRIADLDTLQICHIAATRNETHSRMSAREMEKILSLQNNRIRLVGHAERGKVGKMKEFYACLMQYEKST